MIDKGIWFLEFVRWLNVLLLLLLLLLFRIQPEEEAFLPEKSDGFKKQQFTDVSQTIGQTPT